MQVSGTNIFVYLNDKLGRLQQAFYEERRTKENAAKAGGQANADQKQEGQDGPLGFQQPG